jgi:uncharacterized protein
MIVFGVPLAELGWLAAAVIVAGIVTGILAGLFGIGGGAIIVPVLFEFFRLLGVAEGIRMQLCIGTSLAIIVPTTIRSFRAHRASGLVIPEVIRSWVVPSVAGVAIGSAAAAFAPAALFKLAFVLIAAIIAAKLLFAGDRWALGSELPGRTGMAGYGVLVGLASSLMGISGGSLVTIAAGVGVPITIAGAVGYVLAGLPHQAMLPPLSIGFVSAIGVALIAPISSFVAPLGARLAHALPKRGLEIAFGVFLLIASIRFIFSLTA